MFGGWWVARIRLLGGQWWAGQAGLLAGQRGMERCTGAAWQAYFLQLPASVAKKRE